MQKKRNKIMKTMLLKRLKAVGKWRVIGGIIVNNTATGGAVFEFKSLTRYPVLIYAYVYGCLGE